MAPELTQNCPRNRIAPELLWNCPNYLAHCPDCPAQRSNHRNRIAPELPQLFSVRRLLVRHPELATFCAPFKFYQSGRGESFPENWNDFGGGFGANLGEFVTEFWWILEANFGGFGANLGGIWKRRLKLPWNCALGIALKSCP